MSKFDAELANIEKSLEELKKKKNKMKVVCSHKSKSGKPKLEPVNREKELFQCTKCGEIFHLDFITKDQVNAAYSVMHDTINQIKFLSNVDDEGESQLVTSLGELLYNLKESTELYDKMINSIYKKPKKKKKFREEEYGSYGTAAMSTMGGGRKRW